MQSPLPDSSALEAGILEDQIPSRLSRVQDNVRHLLRTSVLSSWRGSPPDTPTASPRAAPEADFHLGLATPPQVHVPTTYQPEVLPSPSSTVSGGCSASSPLLHNDADGVPGTLFPASRRYRDAVAQMAHQPTLFNYIDAAGVDECPQKQWKRSKGHRRRKGKRHGEEVRCAMAVLSALLLASVIAACKLDSSPSKAVWSSDMSCADLVFATTESQMNVAFHVLFFLGIILATILCAHSMVQLLVHSRSSESSGRLCGFTSTKPRHRRRRRRHEDSEAVRHVRATPPRQDDAPEFNPDIPIPVQEPSGEVRSLPRNDPTTAISAAVPDDVCSTKTEPLPQPPPAYGRWRGSVRADPDLLHWQAVPSPLCAGAPGLPSPTYEEAMATISNSPPSYATRQASSGTLRSQRANAVLDDRPIEPEMFQVSGDDIGRAS